MNSIRFRITRVVLGYTVLLLLISILLSSCKILRSPRIKAEERFKGVNGFRMQDTLTGGLESYIIMHGIGPQKGDYSLKMIKRISELTYGKGNVRYTIYRLRRNKFVNEGNVLNSRNFLIPVSQDSADLSRVIAIPKDLSKVKNKKAPRESVFYTINWSVAVQAERNKLDSEEFDLFAPKLHVGINKLIKRKVMVQRVADAFNGSGPEIVGQVYNVFLRIIRDPGHIPAHRLNLISGSFGSQLFLGCLAKFKDEPPMTVQGVVDSSQNILNDPSFQLNMFMMTNQTNLMDKNIEGWFNASGTGAITRLDIKHVQIIALRNPNDLLSYYLPESIAKRFFSSSADVKVVNAYYFNWPIRNDVASAHTAVFNLKKLCHLVWYGDNSSWVKVKH